MAIALKRAEVNRFLEYRTAYNPEDHNICLALLEFNDGTTDVLAAYSNDSAIPESIRLGLNFIPNLYEALPGLERFGCDGMANSHTEPKLLNYICAAPGIRQTAFGGPLPGNPLYKSVLQKQRSGVAGHAQRLKLPHEIRSVTLVSEIDCCTTCTNYSIQRFRARFPRIPLDLIELGKQVSKNKPPQFRMVTVTKK